MESARDESEKEAQSEESEEEQYSQEFNPQFLQDAVKEKALLGRNELIDLDDTLDGMAFYIFKSMRPKATISTKIMKQLGASI